MSSLTSNDLLLNVVEMSDTLFLSKPPRNAPSTFAPPSNPYNIHRPSVAILLRFLSTNELPTQSRTILTPPPAKNRYNIVYINENIIHISTYRVGLVQAQHNVNKVRKCLSPHIGLKI